MVQFDEFPIFPVKALQGPHVAPEFNQFSDLQVNACYMMYGMHEFPKVLGVNGKH